MEVIIDALKPIPWIEKSTKRRFGFLLILIGIFQLMKHNDTVLEFYKTLYFRIISPIISSIGAAFNIGYLVILIVLIINLLTAFKGFKLKRVINSLLRFWLGLVIAFLMVWGFNYSRSDLSINPEPEDALELFELSSLKTEELLLLSNSEVKSTGSFTPQTDELFSQTLKSITQDLFPKSRTYPKPIPVISDGALRRMGIGGIFFPFSHQPLYDNSAPKITKWFTYCHEYFHSVSVTGEDECNALAFYTLMAADEPQFKLSAYLDVLRTSANVLGYSRADLQDKVGEETYELLEFIWEDQSRYASGFHSISNASNDFYLKSLGSEEGVSAYNGYLKFLKIENSELTLYSEPMTQN